MFAPVVWRFRTYGVPADHDWQETMLALPAMKTWERDAEAEVASLGERAAQPNTPQHQHAVIFTAQQARNLDGYEKVATALVELAKKQPGFLGMNSALSPEGLEITVS